MFDQNKLNISQEHALTALVRNSLSQINPPLIYPLPDKVVALATPEGNFHEMGIIMADILSRTNQWETVYFGANLPASALCESIRALEIPYLILGGLYSGNSAVFQDYLNYLDKNLSIHVILGGYSKDLDLKNFSNIKVEMKSDFIELDNFLKNQ